MATRERTSAEEVATKKQSANETTKRSLDSLRNLLGKTLMIERRLFTFCTEEDHSPHYSVGGVDPRLNLTVKLQEIDPQNQLIRGINSQGQEANIYLIENKSSSLGEYTQLIITRISSGDR